MEKVYTLLKINNQSFKIHNHLFIDAHSCIGSYKYQSFNFLYFFIFQKNPAHLDHRQTDSFLLPWNFNYECSIEKIQSLFYEALKAVNNRVASSGNSNAANKELARLISLPLFINLITLEISNKRHEVAGKLCERLLKSSDAEILKELWISQIFIQRSQSSEVPNSLIEATIKSALRIFPMDSQITFVSAQYYASVVRYSTLIFAY